MQSDGPSPFIPPAASRVPTLLAVLAILIAAVVAWRWSGGWPAEQTPVAALPSRALPSSASALGEPTPKRPPVTAQAPASQPPTAWVRCETHGKVSYSDGDCAGAAATSSSAQTRAALSTVHAGPDAPGTTTVYRCTAYSGAVFWSSNHCHQRKALVDQMISVPSGLDFQQQVVIAERSLPRAQTEVAQAAPRSSASGTQAVALRVQKCKSLEARIRWLDAEARQPQSGAYQDWLRTQRQAARDRQFALRC